MKTCSLLSGIRRACLAAALAIMFTIGCATTQSVDWNSRVGSYTFDQAVTDLGPPNKQAKLSDGKTVAEWVTHRSGGGSFSIRTGIYGSHSSVGVGQTIGSSYNDRVLRLTFGSDGKLATWWKNR